jgi:hypothetical protein
MGEAKRKRDLGEPVQTKTRLQAALQGIQTVGQGVWEIHFYGPETFLPIMLGQAKADADIRADCRLVEQALKEIENRPSQTICLLCDVGFTATLPPWRFIILRPSLDAMRANTAEGMDIVTSCLCKACTTKPDLQAKILDYYRQTFAADLRLLRVVGTGRA